MVEMNLVKSGPCNNCGGTEFTMPTKVGLPAVTTDEQKQLNVDVSKIMVVEIIVCHKCDNIKFFKSKE